MTNAPHGFEMPTVSASQLEAAMKAELPGFNFRMAEREGTQSVEMEVQRQIEGMRLAVSNLEGSMPGTLSYGAQEVVTRLRSQATDAYGLRSYVEQREREAAAKERSEVLAALLAEIETMRPTIIVPVTIYEEDGSGDHYESHERVKDDFPPDLAVLADWARRQQR